MEPTVKHLHDPESEGIYSVMTWRLLDTAEIADAKTWVDENYGGHSGGSFCIPWVLKRDWHPVIRYFWAERIESTYQRDTIQAAALFDMEQMGQDFHETSP